MANRTEVLIIGAGPCGLGAALGLSASLPTTDWQLVDTEPVAGGLAGSVTDAMGFTWDYGGHVTFSSDDAYIDALDELLTERGWNRLERHAWAVVQGEWIEYPVQQHWPRRGEPEPPGRVADAHRQGENLEDWAMAEFGASLVSGFFRPYNEKLWQIPLRELGTQWLTDRVAPSALAPKRPWGPNATFAYPADGGNGEVWRRLAGRLGNAGSQIRYGQTVREIDMSRRVAHMHDGSEILFGSVISTVPIDLLTRMANAPLELRDRTSQLRKTQVTVVGVGMEGTPPSDLPTFTWIYFADPDVPFYRVSQLSAYSSTNTPTSSHWSLLIECSSSAAGDHPPSDTAILDALIRVGLFVDKDSCRSIWRTDLEYGYPVPTLDRDSRLEPVKAWLEERNCFSRGRFGDWAYETSGQDQAFLKGYATASLLVGGDVPSVVDAVRRLPREMHA